MAKPHAQPLRNSTLRNRGEPHAVGVTYARDANPGKCTQQQATCLQEDAADPKKSATASSQVGLVKRA